MDIIDCIAEGIDWPGYARVLEACRPCYCFSNIISVTYSNDLRALQLAKEISSAVTVGMGPHLTNAPERSLQEASGLDFIICHEAEETLRALLDLHERWPAPTTEDLRQVKGIAFLPEGGEPIVTEPRPFIQDLDALPRPRHDLLPLERYWAPFLGRYTFVEASRGCYYRCIFCRQAVMWQWAFRKRSGRAIAEEALYVHSLGVNNILFHADTFTLDRAMVEELCDALIEAGAPFRWACNTHIARLLDEPELIAKMKAAGCWMIAIGIESGDNQVLENIRKQATVEQAESLVRMIDAAGIEAWGYFVLGLPGDTPATLEKTIDLACRLPLKMAKFDIAAPYPGTEFHQYAKDHGYLRIEQYEQFDQNASAVVEYPGLSRAQIKAAVRRANRRFFLRPRILCRVLREAADPTALKAMLLIARDQFRLLGGARRSRADATVKMAGPGGPDA